MNKKAPFCARQLEPWPPSCRVCYNLCTRFAGREGISPDALSGVVNLEQRQRFASARSLRIGVAGSHQRGFALEGKWMQTIFASYCLPLLLFLASLSAVWLSWRARGTRFLLPWGSSQPKQPGPSSASSSCHATPRRPRVHRLPLPNEAPPPASASAGWLATGPAKAL